MGRLWVKALVHEVGVRKRQEVVSRVLKPGGVVFGDEGWRKAVGEGIYQGWAAYGGELRKIYNRSAFVLDIRQPQSRTGLTQRIFDASACAVPVLTEWSPELEALFDPENALLCFKNLEEAVEMKNRYLKDRQEARKKGEKAKRRVLSHHTYLHRARIILEKINQFRE
ncbi:MAG: glycosyltransferase family 1 protein [Deltaproteobacteria bacterium]|nr:glycosyltransferase family 1 protein [Deltaproteobacteria bacterium]